METLKTNFATYLKAIINAPELFVWVPEILNAFHIMNLEKNDFFVNEGEVCSYFCYIEAGVLQHSIEVLTEEKTTYLAMKNSCTSALKSFIHKIPSRKNIKAISDCQLLVIQIDAFHQLLENNKGFKKFYYNLIENQIYRIDDYRIDLLTLTPEERYMKLLSNDPKLLQQVPLHYLASFLGISSRHMSRIRKNIN